MDPLRITVAVTGLGLSGFQVGSMLEQQHGVVMELATQQVSCHRAICIVAVCILDVLTNWDRASACGGWYAYMR